MLSKQADRRGDGFHRTLFQVWKMTSKGHWQSEHAKNGVQAAMGKV